ncbi:unnamed protein product [Cuscuta epithymum]|uniref:Uncharacterized protein n=1 Tax=Cuscuta epithymum TaxID=186058 RepID=A0AAV0FNZ7_9ASTE|nr:unnamed protein product [Cuscuta epithymum]
MDIFGLKMPENALIRQVLLTWWIEAGSKTMADVLMHNLPGIITWHIWRVYASHIWGSESIPSPDQVIFQIKLYTQNLF